MAAGVGIHSPMARSDGAVRGDAKNVSNLWNTTSASLFHTKLTAYEQNKQGRYNIKTSDVRVVCKRTFVVPAAFCS